MPFADGEFNFHNIILDGWNFIKNPSTREFIQVENGDGAPGAPGANVVGFSKKADSSSQEPDEPEESCWLEAVDYPCCSSCSNIYYVDNDGDWGVEYEYWCGLLRSCTN